MAKKFDENTVKYCLYPVVKSKNIDQVKQELNDYVTNVYANLACFLINYIWHYESFQLKVVTDSTKSMFILIFIFIM